MIKSLAITVTLATALGLGACGNTPSERAGSGAVIGGVGGAVVGSAVSGGRAGGTLTGAAVGAASGAVVGAATAPCSRYRYNRRTGRRICVRR